MHSANQILTRSTNNKVELSDHRRRSETTTVQTHLEMLTTIQAPLELTIIHPARLETTTTIIILHLVQILKIQSSAETHQHSEDQRIRRFLIQTVHLETIPIQIHSENQHQAILLEFLKIQLVHLDLLTQTTLLEIHKIMLSVVATTKTPHLVQACLIIITTTVQVLETTTTMFLETN